MLPNDGDFTASASDEMGISSSDNKIFVPIQTLLLRFKDRSLIRADEVEKVNSNKGGGGGVVIIGGMEQSDDAIDEDPDINQLSKIIIQVKETEQLGATANVVKKMLLRRHSELYDFEVTIPELLLKQQQRTKNIFNIVLGAIAGISLIVGGIGIMNIMLASVLERIREIGLRLSIGASKKDIIAQFLAESTLISISGGIIGIIFGVALVPKPLLPYSILKRWSRFSASSLPSAFPHLSAFRSATCRPRKLPKKTR